MSFPNVCLLEKIVQEISKISNTLILKLESFKFPLKFEGESDFTQESVAGSVIQIDKFEDGLV